MALQDLLKLSNNKQKIGISEERVMAILPIIGKFAGFWRQYPDLYVDFLVYGPKVITGEPFTPEEEKENENKFKFYFYQRVFLRCAMRFQYMYATFPRAYSKSFLTVLALILKCILYPGAHLFVTSGGKQQSAEILSQKVQELCRLIPPLEREINWSRGKTQEGKDYVKYIFKNTSVLDNLAAKESSRGQRRHGGSIEECVGVDDKILREVIIPVMAVPRRGMDGITRDNEPVNKSQIYITTAGQSKSLRPRLKSFNCWKAKFIFINKLISSKFCGGKMVPIKYSKIKDGLYSIEEDGRVYSHYSKRYMKTSIDKDGYKTISLRNNMNGYSHFGIHRLLMIAFRPIENMEEMSVDHIDGNKMNNSLDNLQWVTLEENTKLAYLTGLANTKGENHGKSKITEEEALKIIALLKEGYKSPYIIKQIPSSNKGIISSIKNNRTWKHLPR